MNIPQEHLQLQQSRAGIDHQPDRSPLRPGVPPICDGLQRAYTPDRVRAESAQNGSSGRLDMVDGQNDEPIVAGAADTFEAAQATALFEAAS